MSYLNPMSWSGDTHKRTLSVVTSAGIGAILVSPAVVYFAGDMKWLNAIVAKHIVQPHLSQFEWLNKDLHKAHEEYDQEKNQERLLLGEKVIPQAPKTAEQRSYDIANTLVKSTIAFGTDFLATFASQHMLDRLLKVNSNPVKTIMVDAAVTLGAIAVMPTVFAGAFENIRHTFIRKNILEKIFGMDKKRAEDVSGTLTYVAIPSVVATGLSLFGAHHGHTK